MTDSSRTRDKRDSLSAKDGGDNPDQQQSKTDSSAADTATPEKQETGTSGADTENTKDSTDEVRQFKGFLVSVQHPNGTLLGTMNVTGASPPEAGVGEACVGTSLSHTDATPKDYVVFQWIAPANLDPAVDVIVRYVRDILIYRISVELYPL